MRDFTPEAVEYLKIEAPRLTESEYDILSCMVGSIEDDIDLGMAEDMIRRIKGFNFLQKMMYTCEQFSIYDHFTPEALEYLNEEIKTMKGNEINNLGSDLRQRAYWKREEELTLNDAECFIYMAKYPEEVEAMAFGGLSGNMGMR